ncbi:STAS domain-containing protein [Moritella viscosa]|uniref:Possible anti-sigma factor antagonist n=1 Tax=Moritella viscosa TaxID=80854 RepID=A0A090IDE2_9GAMM|nr:STAS domain-containing protein [Moritella viscosa]CED59991.1 putative anti-sigma F factor antagonist [Moritella viscosa]SGY99838.1 Possible anti-sigma factor antagonist [Moritella viscosa]SGZ14762.1 Possible anti-sigma factor antagonist [Moritella viscosa]SGZ14970.1 Possible anti-sigma factor antagonist [Moritella viscosa]SHO14155.1 Possible anti-sigma factor antagonist [Moritella viscosa]
MEMSRPHDGIIVLQIANDLDTEHVVSIQPKLEALVDEYAENIILDFSKVHFIDSTGIGAIVFLFKRLTSQRRTLSLLKVSGQPYKLMTMLRVENAIPFIENITECDASRSA